MLKLSSFWRGIRRRGTFCSDQDGAALLLQLQHDRILMGKAKTHTDTSTVIYKVDRTIKAYLFEITEWEFLR